MMTYDDYDDYDAIHIKTKNIETTKNKTSICRKNATKTLSRIDRRQTHRMQGLVSSSATPQLNVKNDHSSI